MLKLKSSIELGIILRETRTTLRIPVAELAEMVDTTVVSLRRLEQGPPTAAIATLFKLCEELGLELHVSVPPEAGQITLPENQTRPRRTRVRP